MTKLFVLDQRLQNDGEIIGELPLSKIILVNNKLFPWVILIPKRSNAKEIIDLNLEDRILLMKEISFVAQIMQDLFKPDKLNIAALGNIVEQLHVHVITRYKNDKAWPNPVFGGDKEEYSIEEYQKIIKNIRGKLCKN